MMYAGGLFVLLLVFDIYIIFELYITRKYYISLNSPPGFVPVSEKDLSCDYKIEKNCGKPEVVSRPPPYNPNYSGP